MFILYSAGVMFYDYWFMDVEASLSHWEKFQLIGMNDSFGSVISLCQDFVENFCIVVHSDTYLSIFIFDSNFVWFGNEGDSCVLEDSGRTHFLSTSRRV